MKHAYLIIAHHDFDVLKILLNELDDIRNDIYIHFDKKVDSLPVLNVKYSKLFILNDRIDVRWGSISQIQVELLLFKVACNNSNTDYSYYHLLSGVDLPIKSQDYIHKFFYTNFGIEFIGFTQGDYSKEVERKVQRYHLFSSSFRESHSIIFNVKRICRALFLKFQELAGIKRNDNVNFRKGTNWVSVTHKFVKYLLQREAEILQMYKMSYCADEIFLQTICWNSPFKENVHDLSDSRLSSKRMIKWNNNKIEDWKVEDVNFLVNSPGLFARKFSSDNLSLIYQILEKLREIKS